MKKRKVIIIWSILFLLSSGCSNINIENEPQQTQFSINEEAFIDHFQITCTNYETNGNFLKVNYTVTNNSNENHTIETQMDFKLYVSDTEFINSNDNEKITLLPSETKSIEVHFNLDSITKSIPKPYKILFYSNVVSNNVGFILE